MGKCHVKGLKWNHCCFSKEDSTHSVSVSAEPQALWLISIPQSLLGHRICSSVLFESRICLKPHELIISMHDHHLIW